ncbi:hypothetical protein J4727_04105 [Providencia rettgeri]|uniref:Uncharacterized protein n=1 Tax=Providencia rettgeri TaxID=587 RepID=A0A939NBD5_PRORE|nr:hypothetical protein [Providencia rettgeri]
MTTTRKVETVPALIENNENTNFIISTPTADLVDILNKPVVDNNLSESPVIHVEQNIADEDEIPLFNSMMTSFHYRISHSE